MKQTDFDSESTFKFVAWYGECAGDLMWTSLWCWTSPVAWGLLAEIMDNSISKLYHPLANIHLCHPNPKGPWARRRDS